MNLCDFTKWCINIATRQIHNTQFKNPVKTKSERSYIYLWYPLFRKSRFMLYEYDLVKYFWICHSFVIRNGKLAVASVAHATPLFLPHPEIIYINVLHYSAPPQPYLLRATPPLCPNWRHCLWASDPLIDRFLQKTIN